MGSPNIEPPLAIIQRELSTREEGFPSDAYAAYIGALLSPTTTGIIELTGLRHVPGLVQSPATSAAMARHAGGVDPERSERLRNALSAYWRTLGQIPVNVFLSTKVPMDRGQARHLLGLADRGPVTLVQFFDPAPEKTREWGRLTVISEIYPPQMGHPSQAYVEYDEQAPGGAPDEHYTSSMSGFAVIRRIVEAARRIPMTRDASTERLQAIARGETVA